MKKLMFLILATTLMLSAAFVPVDRARKVAENQYMQYCADASTKSANVVNVVENVYEGEVTWYAFEFDNGFVIVSADDAVRPILGYSDHGKIADLDREGGENFKEWFGNYDKQIAYVRSNNVVDETGRKSWKDIEANVFSSTKGNVGIDKLLQSEWDQGWPWNDQTPVIGTDTTPVGCVATAMAQITKYHRWPLTGTGTVRYRPYAGAANITINFADYTFDYDLMPEILVMEYGLYPTYWENLNFGQPEIDQLAAHSLAMGYSAKMNYAVDGSGALMSDARTAMVNNWYCSGTTALQNFATPPAGGTDASYNTIKTQLDAKRPWLWAGGIHAFVLDGYRDDYWYHFNWGWGGSYDGWFHRSSLIPDGIGTGGGDGDYTSGQQGFCIVPNTDPYTAWNSTTVSGSVSGGENVTVNWTAQTGATGYRLYKTFNKNNPVLLTTTTGLTYADNGLPTGEHSYHVIVEYAGGTSHISNSYSVTLTESSTYKTAKYLGATTVGRTNIDLAWAQPLFANVFYETDFETDISWDPSRSSGLWTDGSFGWTNEERWGWQGDYQHSGSYSAVIGYTAGLGSDYPLSWLYSASFTIPAAAFWNFWAYYDGSSYPSRVYYVFYEGAFNEASGTAIAANTTILEQWYEDASHHGAYPEENSIDLTALEGQTGRFAVVYEYNDGNLYAIDDIVLGGEDPTATLPSSYTIYRDGTEIATGVTTTTYSDTGFADGYNEYFVRAIYPTGSSLPSNYATAYMDANPAPDFLTGVGGATAELSWYAPYHNPPSWYSYYDITESVTTIDALDDGTILARRRTRFTGSRLGFYYPATLDSIAAGFYQDDGVTWSQNTFVMRVLDTDLSVLYESGTLTATSGEVYVHALPTPLVVNGSFSVEIETSATTGHPSSLAAYRDDTNSYFYYTAMSSYYYIVTAGDDYMEFCILAHLTSAAPPVIAKSSWSTSTGTEVSRPMEVYRTMVEEKVDEAIAHPAKPKNGMIESPVKSAKEMNYYKIYRDDVEIGTSTTLTYSDSSVPATADYTYKVTASYVNPAGESLPTNEIVLNVQGGTVTPPAPENVITALVGSDIRVSWDASTGATSYDVYSSADPYGTFTFEGNTTNTYYDYTPGTTAKMFFYIKAKN
jgi:fibronectin type 3 domain-containing protein